MNSKTSLIMVALIVLFASTQSNAQEKITYNDHAKPIFQQRCARCHNPDKKSGGLDLMNYTNLMQGGSSGSVIEPGDADGSYMQMLVTHDEEPVMPPGGKIPDNEIQMLAKWINGGALESKTSVAKISKPKFEMAVGSNPNARPEIAPMPPRLVLEPNVYTKRASNANAMATSPWAPIVAVGMARQVLLYNTTTMQLVGVLPFPEGQVYKLKFSRNGSILIAGGGKDGATGMVVGWNIRTGDRVFNIGEELDAVMAADISTDHTMVALGGPSKLIKVYSTSDGSLLYQIKKHTEWVTALEFSPDGVLLATGDRNGGLHVWEAETGNEYLTLKAHTKQINALSWRVDGNILASTSEDTTTKLWEMENGRAVKSWGSHGGGSLSVDFTRDGNILTSGKDRTVKLWKQDGAMIHQFGGLGDIAIACCYCDESKRVFGADWAGKLMVWNSADKAHLGNLSTNPPPLQDRIAFLTGLREKAKGEYAPVEAAFNQMNNQLAEVVANLNTKSTALQTAETEFTNSQNSLNTANKNLETANADAIQVQAAINEKNAALVPLRESAAKAAEASAKIPADEELKASAAQLAAKIKKMDAEVAQLQTQMNEKQMMVQNTKQQVDKFKAEFAQKQSKKNEMAKQVTDLTKQKEPLEKQVAAKKGELDAAATKVSNLEAAVNKWTDELNFSNHMKSLYQKLAETENVLIAEAEKVALADKAAKEAQAQADAAKAAEAKVQGEYDSIEQAILQAKGIGNQ